MRILHVITEIEQGGAEKQLAYLAYLQKRQGHEVYLGFLEGKGELKSSFISSSVTLYPPEAKPIGFLGFFSLARFVQSEGIEIIHAHLPKAELFATMLSKFVDAKLIVTKHNCERFWPRGPKWFSRLIARKVESRAAKVICISDSVQAFLQNCKEISNTQKCEVVPYSWVDPNFFKPIESRVWQEPIWFRGAKNIITIARLVPQKNLETLIRSMSSLNIVFNLDIYGVGPMHNQLKALIRDLSLDSKVHLMGFEKNIENVLQNYDLFVLPSKYEGFGLSVLEAIVQRRKIAVARNDALSEVLGAQFPYLFDPDSEESIANTIKEALDAGAEKFYESYERILERYTPERMIKKVSGIYFEVVKSNE